MEGLVIVGLVAIVWYLATRERSGYAAPRSLRTSDFHSPRSADWRTATDSAERSAAQRIQSAIDAGRDIRFNYTDAKGSLTRRTVHPERFVEFSLAHGEGRSVCVQGHCRLRSDSRTFALRRISELEIL